MTRAQAIEPGNTGTTAVRRFDRPSRLAPAEIAALAGALSAALAEVERDLARGLRRAPALALTAVEEVAADDFVSSLPPAPLALCFDVAGEPGWLAMERAAAVAVLEDALGAAEAAAREARALSAVECAALARLMGGLVAKLARAAGLAAGACRVAQDADAIGTWRRGERSDPHRLLVRIAVDAAGGATELRLHLPGVGPRAIPAPRAKAPIALPPALAEVEVGISARLGAADVPLAELLALEVGDVIPLGVPVGAAVTVHVEDAPRMRGLLGRSGDRLAVRLTATSAPTEPTSEPQP